MANLGAMVTVAGRARAYTATPCTVHYSRNATCWRRSNCRCKDTYPPGRIPCRGDRYCPGGRTKCCRPAVLTSRTCDGCAACSPERGAAVSPRVFALSAAGVPTSKASVSSLSRLSARIRALCCLSRLYLPTICMDAAPTKATRLSHGNGHRLCDRIKPGFTGWTRLDIRDPAGCNCSYHVIECQPAIHCHCVIYDTHLPVDIGRHCRPLSQHPLAADKAFSQCFSTQVLDISASLPGRIRRRILAASQAPRGGLPRADHRAYCPCRCVPRAGIGRPGLQAPAVACSQTPEGCMAHELSAFHGRAPQRSEPEHRAGIGAGTRHRVCTCPVRSYTGCAKRCPVH